MKYYIIAGEASGDLHGSNLIKKLAKRDDKMDVRCWGGDKMKAAGGHLVKHFNSLAFMGFAEVLMNLRTIFRNLAFCKKDILAFQPDAIILIDYIDEIIKNYDDKVEAIIQAGATRLTPVMLTALSTILGLLPLAIGININFLTLFTDLDPQIYFGGDSVAFWNPLAWTIIFGLTFATFLTLIVVPVMYKIVYVKK